VALIGLIAGIGLGLFVAYAMEWLKPVMRSAQRVERDLQLRPVISIPYTMPVQERRRRRMIWGAGLAILIAGVAVAGVAMGLF
tara:strand:+ start:279 stop:527 length:249 start_codon:yes stop_codon:yes gene_type:complete